MNTPKVKLVAATVPVLDDIDSAEDFIAYAARVSNPKSQEEGKNPVGLVKYLILHKHWSPFEMAHVVIEINTTRDIARQILRHRSFSFQEFSQRYADPSSLGALFVDSRECRLQDPKNRQNSIETSDYAIKDIWNNLVEQSRVVSESLYKSALDLGIAKEQARCVLPEGLTKSRMYMSGSLRSWVHYCEIRMGKETQKEHREIAKACWEVLRLEFPNIIEACEDLQDDDTA